MKKYHVYDIFIVLLVIVVFSFIKIPYLNTFLAFLIIMGYAYATEGLKKSLGFSKKKNVLKLLGTAMSLAVVLAIVNYFIVLTIIESIVDQPLQLGIFGGLKGNVNVYIQSVLIGCIVGGLFEEVIFRGFMISSFIRMLGKRWGPMLGIVFSSIFFGYLHAYQGLTGQVLVGITGVALGVIYILSKRDLWLTIFTHAFANIISMTLLFFGLFPQ
ncbi:MAG: type II CAAX endopeptidase family protein [Saprospiraceae bacterium]|nr:type II CAAX endopeptidase family protein [Saprospiraceae bacterium]